MDFLKSRGGRIGSDIRLSVEVRQVAREEEEKRIGRGEKIPV